MRPVIVEEDDHNETGDTSSLVPPVISPLESVSPFTTSDDDISSETHNRLCDDSNNVVGPGPSSAIKKSRGRPKGNNVVGPGPSSAIKKSSRGRPKGSKTTRAKKPKAYDPKVEIITSIKDFDSEITEEEKRNGNERTYGIVMMQFNAVMRRFIQLGIKKDKLDNPVMRRCKELGLMTNEEKRIGPISGIQVGDIFYTRQEMFLVGLHNDLVGGIAYMTDNEGSIEELLATSIVVSEEHGDKIDEVHTLSYTGKGENDKDQTLEKGNLALMQSYTNGNDVRVIIKEVLDPSKKKNIYIYNGLYSVSIVREEKTKKGFKVFKFELTRKPGQSSGYEVWKSIKIWRRNGLDTSRPGFILEDLSYGKETLPVLVINEMDPNDESVPQDFKYTTSQFYSWVNINITAEFKVRGCKNCRGQSCVKSCECICLQRNDGKLPYDDSVLLCRKPMIYECNNLCPCDSDCKLRLVQNGMKIQVEVFKTENYGWGLRSLNPIRAGTFICEFAGVSKTTQELEEDEDEDDEYLFDSSRVYNRFKWNHEPELARDRLGQDSEAFNLPSRVLISAKEEGNVARFMNHSCSPNVLWQPIEFERVGETYVRIGFFALKHVSPMTELTYDYGMSLETAEVGEDGKKKFKGKKICLCGSSDCRGSFG